MSKLVYRIVIVIVFFIFVNCSINKQVTKVPTVPKNQEIEFPEVTIDEEVYIPRIKNERRDFFPKTEGETVWVDSIYNQMTFEEKVGQLFMVAAYSNKDAAHSAEIDKLVSDYKIGGLIFFQGGPRTTSSFDKSLPSQSQSAFIYWHRCRMGFEYAFRLYLSLSLEHDTWCHSRFKINRKSR